MFELKNNNVIFTHSMHLQVENSVQRVLAKERASQSKALDLQSQLNRAKSEQSQLKRSKEEVCEMSSLDSRSQRAPLLDPHVTFLGFCYLKG